MAASPAAPPSVKENMRGVQGCQTYKRRTSLYNCTFTRNCRLPNGGPARGESLFHESHGDVDDRAPTVGGRELRCLSPRLDAGNHVRWQIPRAGARNTGDITSGPDADGQANRTGDVGVCLEAPVVAALEARSHPRND